MKRTWLLLLALLVLGACEQQKQTQDQWASMQVVWAQSEDELNASSREVLDQLRAVKEGPQAATAAELSMGLEGALNELRKTRLTVVEDVKRGGPGPELEARVAAAGTRMSSALAKVEGRLAAARKLTQPVKPEVDEKKETGGEAN